MIISKFLKNSSILITALALTSCTTSTETVDTPENLPAPIEKKTMTPIVQKPQQSPAQLLKSVSIGNESPENLVILAERYYNGVRVKKDIKKALKLFVKAAEKGNGYACRRLGLEYSDFAFDDLTPRDDQKARKWFEKGAKLGDSESMFYLSQFLFEGRGGPKDEAKASEILVSAARSNSRAAAHRALKLAKKHSISISQEDKAQFYLLDKNLHDAISLM